MKKTLTFFATFLCVFSMRVQTLQAQSAGAPQSPLFATDITIETNHLANQRHVRVASAYNGWLFAAYLVNDTTTNKGGVVVRYSKDGGITWAAFNGYPYYQHSTFTNCDISVAGMDTTQLAVFVAYSRKDATTQKYEVGVKKYNPMHVAFAPVQVMMQQLDSNKVYDLSLTNDYRFPAPKDSIYSVGLLYSHKGATMDSLLFNNMHKAMGKFKKSVQVVATGKNFRHVSLGYASSATVTGNYFAAWELLDTANSTLAHAYVARTMSNIDSAWTTPKCLDSLSASTLGRIRNPSIACQYSGNDNDSANVTVAVVFECARNGSFTDSMDVLGYYNKAAAKTSFWTPLSLAATTDNELQPYMVCDPSGNKFLVTYYDSTTGSLAYGNAQYNTPAAWTMVTAQYNDNTANLKAPWPRVVANPQVQKPFFAWVMDPANKNGVVLCDGQYLNTSVAPEAELTGLKIYNLFPNPAQSALVLPVYLETSTSLSVSVLNLLGQEVMPAQKINAGPGMQQVDLNVSDLSAGVYLCRLTAAGQVHTLRFVKQN
jgi:hypothetical protein